jgi:FlaA1/EpsC-like NDP-sugar epimerase
MAGLLPEKDIAIEFVGLRPGEKLEEELVGPGEVALETSIDRR